MIEAKDIENALLPIVSEGERVYVSVLANLIMKIANNEVEPATFSSVIESEPGLRMLFNSLSGKEITAKEAVLSFGSNSQFGDVKLRDVIGGNVYSFNFFSDSKSKTKLNTPEEKELPNSSDNSMLEMLLKKTFNSHSKLISLCFSALFVFYTFYNLAYYLLDYNSDRGFESYVLHPGIIVRVPQLILLEDKTYEIILRANFSELEFMPTPTSVLTPTSIFLLPVPAASVVSPTLSISILKANGMLISPTQDSVITLQYLSPIPEKVIFQNDIADLRSSFRSIELLIEGSQLDPYRAVIAIRSETQLQRFVRLIFLFDQPLDILAPVFFLLISFVIIYSQMRRRTIFNSTSVDNTHS